jgi:hypothetical protein
VSRDERPLRFVGKATWVALALVLVVQFAWRASQAPGAPAAADLPPPPTVAALRVASFAEAETMARLAMLYLQAYLPRELDYRRLVAWLEAILALDPRSDYPLFAAARIYAENPDPARSRLALDFVHRQFLADPDRRWPWLAHAALLAKHRLKDLPLARQYAAAVARHARSADVPLWARQMEVFILEDMGELEAARIMLGGLLESGQVTDPGEARFLRHRLEELERRR